jgi:DNA-binding response OmpR family regulator
MNMPNVNGVRFVEELQRKKCKSRKIGMMSGDWSQVDSQKAKRMGVTVFDKPFELQKLRTWITETGI